MIYNSNLNEVFFSIKIIFIYLDMLTAVKLFPNLYQKMNPYLEANAIIN